MLTLHAKPMKKILRFILIILLVLLASVATFFIILFSGGFGKIPSKTELEDLKNETATLVLSAEGNVVGKFFSENRTNVAFDSIPNHLINALIATEDARFYEHKGVDSKALMRVLFKTILRLRYHLAQ